MASQPTSEHSSCLIGVCSDNPNAVLISTCPDPDVYLFWDEIHPTSKVGVIRGGTTLIEACQSQAMTLVCGALGHLSMCHALNSRAPLEAGTSNAFQRLCDRPGWISLAAECLILTGDVMWHYCCLRLHAF